MILEGVDFPAVFSLNHRSKMSVQHLQIKFGPAVVRTVFEQDVFHLWRFEAMQQTQISWRAGRSAKTRPRIIAAS